MSKSMSKIMKTVLNQLNYKTNENEIEILLKDNDFIKNKYMMLYQDNKDKGQLH